MINIKVNTGIKYLTTKIFFIFLFFLLFTHCFESPIYAAALDELYPPFLQRNQCLYETSLEYFRLDEDAVHADSSYEQMEAEPHFYTFNNSLRFSPSSFLDLKLGFGQIFSDSYNRLLFDPDGDLSLVYDYELDYLQDNNFKIRLRDDNHEFYLDFLQKRQKSNWNYTILPASTYYFVYIRSHYEDIKVGLRHLSKPADIRKKTNLSKIKRPLMDSGQFNLETELGYKYGKIKRKDGYLGFYYNYFHTLTHHLIQKLNLKYGLNNHLELESGITFTNPFKYEYEYVLYYTNGTTQIIRGTYKLKDNFYVPLKLRCRPKDNFQIMLSSDFNFINQRLTYWQKATDNTITSYPEKKLTYYNTKPTIKLTYIHNANKEIQEDNFSALTKHMLLKKQFLIEFQYQKDITHLSKNSDNGPQNIIDPYSIFQQPLDFFMTGSEYAVFSAGNYSRYATNVKPQNYYILEAAFLYGLNNSFNTGIKVGYHSHSKLHHFTLNDLVSRLYKFNAYYYFDFLCDWRITKNSLLSFKTHFVPNYTNYLQASNYAPEHKTRNRYIEVSLILQILF